MTNQDNDFEEKASFHGWTWSEQADIRNLLEKAKQLERQAIIEELHKIADGYDGVSTSVITNLINQLNGSQPTAK